MKASMIGAALAVVAIAAGAPARAETVFSTGFEPPGYATGQLAGQNGWFNDTNAFVQNSTVESGLQAVSVSDNTTGQYVTYHAVSYNSVGNPDKLVTISTGFELSAVGSPIYWEALVAIDNSPRFITQFLVNGETGQACGYNPCNGPILAPGTWYDLSMLLNYSTGTATDFVDGVAFSSGSFYLSPTTLGYVGLGINDAYGLGDATASWDNISVSSSVPEPSTWAMMLAGFGFLGLTGWRKAVKTPLAA